MEDGTLSTSLASPGVGEFDIEHSFSLTTGVWRAAFPLSESSQVKTLRCLFAAVELISLSAEIRQDSLAGEGESEIVPSGHVYVALIPSQFNTDVMTGANAQTVNSVQNKQTFPLSGNEQNNKVFRPSLEGYELDLAQDPRRGAGPVAWLGNSGVRHAGKSNRTICTATWSMKVRCSGKSALWF